MRWIMAVAWLLPVMLGGLGITAGSAHAADEEARVLILNGTDPYLPAYLEIDSAMRASLAQEPGRRVVYFSEPLDAQRFQVETYEPELIALLAKKYAGLRFDVVVAVSQRALEFFNRYGALLWPGARLVFSGWPGEVFESASGLPPDAAAVVADVNVRETFELARRMQPKARRLVVISGASDLDRRNEAEVRRVLGNGTDRLPIEYLTGLPLPELVSRVAAEPADTIVFYVAQFRDREGRPYTPREVLRAISTRSVAPIFGMVETYIGFGMAAGIAESYEDHGRLIGQLVHEALAGRSPAPERTLLHVSPRCVADARALQRWSLDERRLPDGCEVRFSNHTFWREHWWQILAALAVIVAQSLLIATLFAQRRRSRVAEAESRKRLSEMAHMNRRVALGEMSASIAHELNQPLGAIYNNAGAAEILIKADPPQLDEVAEILGDIKRDDQRASDIIARIRKFLRKSEFELRETDLNEAVEESMKTIAGEAQDKGVVVRTEYEPGLPKVNADRVQLQQVIVNLALNAMEAMQNTPTQRRVLAVRSRRADDRHAEVSVADSGDGIAPELRPNIFEPFVTSKSTGMGLGLAISRTIIEAHGGQIDAEDAHGGGTVFRFTLPFASAQRT